LAENDLLIGMILSFFLPGIGQGYLTKDWVKGIIFLVITMVLSIFLVGILVWAYGLYDTYKIAKAKEGAGPYKSILFGQIG